MGYATNFQNEMRTVKIEAQASSGVEGNLRTFLSIGRKWRGCTVPSSNRFTFEKIFYCAYLLLN
jgi:alkyl hydroperoxide reductase subunit AhpF